MGSEAKAKESATDILKVHSTREIPVPQEESAKKKPHACCGESAAADEPFKNKKGPERFGALGTLIN